MPPFEGFVGPAYSTRSINASAEDLYNLYLETQESPGATPRVVLYGTPGSVGLMTLPTVPVRGQLYQDGRAWAAGGPAVYETTSGVPVFAGAIADDLTHTPVTFHSNGDGQIFIVASGNGYILNYLVGTFTPITDANFPNGSAIRGDYLDGYFLVLANPGSGPLLNAGGNPANFSVSQGPPTPNGLIWTPQQAANRSIASDTLVSMIVNHRELWLFGSVTSEGWYDSGTSVSANFPFSPIPGVFIDQGCAAPWSPARLDNSVAWLARNRDGDRMVMLVNQLAPQRISTFAVEESLRQCPTVSDFIGFTYQEGGHLFYVLTSAVNDLTWAYDPSQGPTTGWAKRSYWDQGAARHRAIRARNHVAAFGSHWVGDRASGVIYQQGCDLFSDAQGTADAAVIRAVRKFPHVNVERHRLVYDLLEIDGEFGVGAGAGQAGAGATLMLDLSNNGGHTLRPTQLLASLGARGAYGARARFTRLGSSDNRVFQLSMTDPVKRCFTAAYLKVRPGVS